MPYIHVFENQRITARVLYYIPGAMILVLMKSKRCFSPLLASYARIRDRRDQRFKVRNSVFYSSLSSYASTMQEHALQSLRVLNGNYIIESGSDVLLFQDGRQKFDQVLVKTKSRLVQN